MNDMNDSITGFNVGFGYACAVNGVYLQTEGEIQINGKLQSKATMSPLVKLIAILKFTADRSLHFWRQFCTYHLFL